MSQCSIDARYKLKYEEKETAAFRRFAYPNHSINVVGSLPMRQRVWERYSPGYHVSNRQPFLEGQIKEIIFVPKFGRVEFTVIPCS